MAAAPTDSVYHTDNIAVPLEVQDHFSSQYNMDDPEQARLCYMRVMHEHTKQQFQMATASSRRRNSPATHDMANLTTESSNGSVSSTASRYWKVATSTPSFSIATLPAHRDRHAQG
ncbi:hypothetical protein KVT40_003779 [Elsinoe batatas]|uniref:Uncharacterized protein n=1 Tax=Elsinoe batatas TaxID=2601811 RepID=A0A8K0L577_9PEZI|nr:hypothetical protein KVT40_003779 [Elsinoe batatas]